jgi:Flp pilus assembly protein TadD
MNRNPLPTRCAVLLLSLSALSACTTFPANDGISPPAVKASALPPATVKTGLDKAHALRGVGDYAGATRILGQLLIAMPDDARIVSEYGKVLTEMGRTKEAIDFLTRAAVLSPTDWTVQSSLGVAYDQIGEPAKAAGAYEAALKLKPGDPGVLNNYALSKAMAGDAAAAKILIEQAAARSDDPKIRGNRAMIASLSVTAPPALKPTARAEEKPQPPQAAPTGRITAKILPPTAAKSDKVVDAKYLRPSSDKPETVAKSGDKKAKNLGTIPALRLTADTQ